MKNILNQPDWHTIANQMHDNGYVLIKDVLTSQECDVLVKQYDDQSIYRKTISMERYRFGLGEYSISTIRCRILLRS